MPTLERHSLTRPSSADAQHIAEALKAEADRQLFILPREATSVAAEIQRLGVATGQPSIQALGVMTAADALRELGAYADALREYDRAGALYLSVGDEVGWARTRSGVASTRIYTGELGPILHDAARAREILARHGLWMRLARLESATGKLLRELGRTQAAVAMHTQAVETAMRVEELADRELLLAEIRISQALLCHRLDQYDQADGLLHWAAATFRRYGRPGPVAVAESNLARSLAARGHVTRALALANEVRQVMQSLGRASDASMAGQVAIECLLELNRGERAAALANDSIAQLSAKGASAELAKTLLLRATAFERLDQHAAAAGDLARAEELFRAGGCVGWAAVARLHHAQALERSGRATEALVVSATAAVELRQRGQVVAAARAHLAHAAASRQLNRLPAAFRGARVARRVAHRIGVPLLEYQAWRLLGDLHVDSGNHRAALRAYASAAGALEKSQGRILSEQRAGFLRLQDKLVVYENALRLCVEASQPRRAFAFAERSKARALVDALALRAAGVVERPDTPAACALTQELQTLRRKYDRLCSTLFDPSPLDDLGAIMVATGSAAAELELHECEARMESVLHELRLTQADRVDRQAALQGKIFSPLPYLQPGTLLIQYATAGDALFVFVVRRGAPIEVRCAPVGALDQVARLRRVLELNVTTATRGHHDAALQQQAQSVLQRLYRLLIGPVADLIEGAERLVIVPHGTLHAVPFAALHDGARYLVERCELVLEPSASAIAFVRRGRTARTRRNALVIAHSADGDLPGALAEGEAVAELFGGMRLFESDASVTTVCEQLQRADVKVVHVAAHGRSRPDAPLFSHLRLADGQLTALDFLNLNMDCDLVTLSACETGRATLAAGDEPIGLTRCLLYGGARSVIHSLWRVDDAATRQLMTDIYRRLRSGAGRGEALRQAQLAFVQADPSQHVAHPAFWAAFTLVGDWRRLQ